MSVEKQIAIIFCGTRNLLRNIPVNKVSLFELEYLNFMEMKHQVVLKDLKEGIITDEDMKIMEGVAKDLSQKYEEKKI